MKRIGGMPGKINSSSPAKSFTTDGGRIRLKCVQSYVLNNVRLPNVDAENFHWLS